MSDLINAHPAYVAETERIKRALHEQCGQRGTAAELMLQQQRAAATPTPTAIGVSSAGVVRAAPALVPVERPWLDGESFAAARARQPQGEITEGGVMRL